jgi:hypothetical protein
LFLRYRTVKWHQSKYYKGINETDLLEKVLALDIKRSEAKFQGDTE